MIRRRTAIALLLASGLPAFGDTGTAPPPAGPAPEALLRALDAEAAAANAFRAAKAMAERRAREAEALRKAEEAAAAARRAVFENWIEAEWLAGDPAAVLARHHAALKEIRRESAAGTASLGAVAEEMRRGAKAAEERAAALEKKLEEAAGRLDALAKVLDEKEAALRKTFEDRAKAIESALEERRAAGIDAARRIDLLRLRGMRDLERETFDGIEFVRIPAGEFTMGTTPEDVEALKAEGLWNPLKEVETPARRVRIPRPFLLGRFEVTQRQWNAVMGKNPSAFKGDDLPVESISWDDVRAFIVKLNQSAGGPAYRLPSEAEWEYARRAGSAGPWGAAADGKPLSAALLPDNAWLAPNSEHKPHPAGGKPANAWGLHDMAGNVWEWCEDWFDPGFYAKGPAEAPLASEPSTERVMRGGAYALDPGDARPATRGAQLPDFKSPLTGFRLARDLPE